jgi:hypothetical protein
MTEVIANEILIWKHADAKSLGIVKPWRVQYYEYNIIGVEVKSYVLAECKTQKESIKEVKRFKNKFPTFKRFPIKIRIQRGN